MFLSWLFFSAFSSVKEECFFFCLVPQAERYGSLDIVHATLVIEGAEFPNLTIYKGWFSGGHDTFINAVHIVRSRVNIIELDAFASKYWLPVMELTFDGIKSLKCLSGWANGLTLNHLSFIETGLVNVEYNFLYGCRVVGLTIRNSLKDSKIIDITGVGIRNEMQYVYITTAENMRRIGVMDFTGVRFVKQLYLPYCGIESIADNSLTYMQRLKKLDLRGNLLKTLPGTIFDSLLERRRLLSISLQSNHWQCYCDLIRVRNVLDKYGISFLDFPDNCGTNVRRSIALLSSSAVPCKNNTDKLAESSCRTQFGFNFIYVSYPKITLRIDQTFKTMYLQHNQSKFYSIRITHSIHKSTQQLNNCNFQSIECRIYRTTNRSITISVPQNTKSRSGDDDDDDAIEMFCFLDTLSKSQIWPLNCFTYCRACNGQHKHLVWLRIESIYFAIAILLTVVIVVLLLGMIFGYLLVCAKPQLLTGNERVVILQSTNGRRRESVTIFIMPSNYVNPMEAEWFVVIVSCFLFSVASRP